MEEAAIAIAGIAVGALAAGAVNLGLEIRRERRQGVALLRVLFHDLTSALAMLNATLAGGNWWAYPFELPTQNWRDQIQLVAAHLGGGIPWDRISYAFLGLSDLQTYKDALAEHDPAPGYTAARDQAHVEDARDRVENARAELEEILGPPPDQ